MFVYISGTSVVAENFATSATPNTMVDQLFIKPGTRTIGIQALLVGGKGGGLTTLSAIAYRLRKWTTTAAAGGTGVTPTPKDPGAQACKATAGAASAGVTVGTGGPSFVGGCVSSAAGPGGWVATNEDAMPKLEGSDNKSIDLFTASPTASLNFEANVEHVE